jgi:hypothetical protein
MVAGESEGDLQRSLCQAVNAERQADQAMIISARQTTGINREYRQDKKQSEHPQSINGRQCHAGATLAGVHSVIRGPRDIFCHGFDFRRLRLVDVASAHH